MYQVGSLASLIFFSISFFVFLLFVRDENNQGSVNLTSKHKGENSKHVSKLRLTPESIRQLLQMIVECGFIMLYIWWCENMPYTPHEQKFGTKTLFWSLFVIFIVFALATFKRNKNSINSVLNRDQTEEWKGWMQYLFLAYHYFNEKEVYNAIRIFISCYVWMTGFGNVSFFYIKQDFGIIRFLQMMWRLNFFVFLLCVILDNTYILYYICPLHTFYFLTTFVVMRIRKQSNHASQFILRLKLISFGILVFLIWEFPSIFNIVWSFLPTTQIIGAQSGTRHEWHFRSGLDHYSAMFGMVFAINFPLFVSWTSRVEKVSSTKIICIKGFILILLLIGFYLWVKNIFVLPKLQYNQVHPYFFWIPLLFYIYVRNVSRYGRAFHSNLLAQMGKITLETYLLQHHVWLADNAKSRMFRITIGLRAMLIPSDKNEAYRNLICLFAGFGLCYVLALTIMSLQYPFTTKVMMIIWTTILGTISVYNFFQLVILKERQSDNAFVTDSHGKNLKSVGTSILSSIEVANNKNVSGKPQNNFISLIAIEQNKMLSSILTYFIGMVLFYVAGGNEVSALNRTPLYPMSKVRDCTSAMGTGTWSSVASKGKCEIAIDEYHGKMCFTAMDKQFIYQFAKKNVYYPNVQDACPSERPITHYSAKPALFWQNVLHASTISIVGDSLARKMTQGLGRLVGHAINFAEADRHKDKLTSTAEDTDINFYWRPMASNVNKWLLENSLKKCSLKKRHYILISIGAWHVRWDPKNRIYSLKYSLDALKSTMRDLRMRCPAVIIGWMLPPKIEPDRLSIERRKNMTDARYHRVLDATKSSILMNKVDFILQADQITNNAIAKELSLDGVHHHDIVYDVFCQTFGNQLLRLDKLNAKLSKIARGANSLAGIAHNPTIGMFTLFIFILIVLTADNYFGVLRLSSAIFGVGHTNIEESYKVFHANNGI